MRQMPFVALVLLLSGCADGPDRAAFLNQFVGRPEQLVVQQFGVPQRTIAAGGHQFLAYDQSRTAAVFGGPFIAGAGFGYGYGGLGFGYSAFPTEIVERRCETTFEVAGGTVVNWSLRGNAC